MFLFEKKIIGTVKCVMSTQASPMDGVIILHQDQMCGTASPNTSETQHYPLIRIGGF